MVYTHYYIFTILCTYSNAIYCLHILYYHVWHYHNSAIYVYTYTSLTPLYSCIYSYTHTEMMVGVAASLEALGDAGDGLLALGPTLLKIISKFATNVATRCVYLWCMVYTLYIMYSVAYVFGLQYIVYRL